MQSGWIKREELGGGGLTMKVAGCRLTGVSPPHSRILEEGWPSLENFVKF